MIISTLTPSIPYFDATLTKIAWRLSYPDNLVYFELRTDNDIAAYQGNYTVSDSIIQAWGADDSVITDAIIAAAPWNLNI
jgi:hypothetical protein